MNLNVQQLYHRTYDSLKIFLYIGPLDHSADFAHVQVHDHRQFYCTSSKTLLDDVKHAYIDIKKYY